jgi:hypothetical protein
VEGVFTKRTGLGSFLRFVGSRGGWASLKSFLPFARTDKWISCPRWTLDAQFAQNSRTEADLNEVPSAFGSGHGFLAACYPPQDDSPFTEADLGYQTFLAIR